MLCRIKRLLKIVLPLVLVLNPLIGQAYVTKTIKKQTAEYIIYIKYPQGFKSAAMNVAIKKYIDSTQTKFLKEAAADSATPADAPGKTGLNITYSVPYKAKAVFSVQFNVMTYHKGAAHPSNRVEVANFISGKPVQLADLFVSGSGYLKPISDYARKKITAKNISDEKWIAEGTRATVDNYGTWCFNKKGIAIIFNTYQVAAYVYGEQKVIIPLTLVASMIKPQIKQIVWGN